MEIRYPERGRKQIDYTVKKFKTNLEIRYPERGRKLLYSSSLINSDQYIFGNKIPREGTETEKASDFSSPNLFSKFGNKIPREGTETHYFLFSCHTLTPSYLEIRYPERGRKQLPYSILSQIKLPEFGNKIP